MYTVSAASLTKEMALVESVDNQIGYELEPESKPALLTYTTELLLDLEKEMHLRDTQLKNRDSELMRNIQIIDNLYNSRRYRIGKFFIQPIEIISLKLGLIDNPQNTSKTDNTNVNRAD